jgi:hypothetical protein
MQLKLYLHLLHHYTYTQLSYILCDFSYFIFIFIVLVHVHILEVVLFARRRATTAAAVAPLFSLPMPMMNALLSCVLLTIDALKILLRLPATAAALPLPFANKATRSRFNQEPKEEVNSKLSQLTYAVFLSSSFTHLNA